MALSTMLLTSLVFGQIEPAILAVVRTRAAFGSAMEVHIDMLSLATEQYT
jgi:hypothetical protein